MYFLIQFQFPDALQLQLKIQQSGSTLKVQDCLFENNSGKDGGVFFRLDIKDV